MNQRIGLLTVGLLLTACGGAPGAEPVEPDPVGTTDLPPAIEAAAGTRLVGQGRVVLAVPESWRTAVYDACARPRALTVYFLTGQRQACDRSLSPRGAFATVEEIESDDEILLAMDRGPTVDQARTRRTGLTCRTAPVGGCDQAFAFPGEGILVQVHMRGPDARAALRRTGRSLQLLPQGWTTVPPIAYGTSDDDALAALEEAGLVGVVPEVDWPHYVTATVPPVGTVVAEGSEVDLEIGDG